MEEVSTVQVQNYEHLAGTYDELRYTSAIDILKQSFTTSAILELLPAHNTRTLDVACGTGRGLAILIGKSKTAIGIDGTMEMLHEAARKVAGAAHLCRANAGALPFPDASFDTVTCLNFVHLFDDTKAKRNFVSEIARVLRPGGTAIIEFNNAMHGVVLGPIRKHMGQDIGYEWPWTLTGYFDHRFKIARIRGTNIPVVWRFPPLRFLEGFARWFPINYLASRLLVQAIRQ